MVQDPDRLKEHAERVPSHLGYGSQFPTDQDPTFLSYRTLQRFSVFQVRLPQRTPVQDLPRPLTVDFIGIQMVQHFGRAEQDVGLLLLRDERLQSSERDSVPDAKPSALQSPERPKTRTTAEPLAESMDHGTHIGAPAACQFELQKMVLPPEQTKRLDAGLSRRHGDKLAFPCIGVQGSPFVLDR